MQGTGEISCQILYAVLITSVQKRQNPGGTFTGASRLKG